MNNATAAAQLGLPDVKTLIRPDHIRQMRKFPEDLRDKYIAGVTELWNKIENNDPDSDEYRKAHLRLYDVTKNVRMTMAKAGTAATAQQNGVVRPVSSGQPGQQDSRPPAMNTQGGVQPQAAAGFSPKVIEEVKKLNIIAPTNLGGNEVATKQWIRDAQRKYAENLQRLDTDQKRLTQLHQVASTRAQQGKPLDQRETESYQTKVAVMEQNMKECKQTLQTFQSQQEQYKLQQMSSQTNTGMNAALNTNQAPHSSTQNQASITGGGGQSQLKQEPQGQPHTLSSAVDAARNQGSVAARSAMSPHNSGQSQQSQTNQPPNSRPQPHQVPASHSHPPLNINTSGPQNQQHNSPRVALSQSSTMPHEPVPLSHSAAVDAARDAARSYSQPNIAQQTPQSATHGPSSDQRNQNNHMKMPIPKDLNLAPTQPVSVGPSRPTLTNGPLAMGPMGQPAIQRHPGYVLEGDGERILGKKKLEELVRQVTGGTGGEGEEGEGLTAEVEEV